MDVRRLQVFRAVAKQRSFTHAALRLHLSQSAVSQQIAALERELGGRLLERTQRRVALTPEGAALYERIDDILAAVAEAERAVAAARGAVEGDLSVAASRTVGNYMIPTPLAMLGRRHPGLRIRVAVQNTEQVLRSLSAGRADVGYVEGEIEHPGIELRPLLRDELVLVAAAGHRFASAPPQVSLDELAVEPLVVREPGSGTRQVAQEKLRAAGLDLGALRVAAELTGIEAIKLAVERGLGVAILSQASVVKEAALGTLVVRRLAGVSLERRISVAAVAGATVLPAARELTALLLESHPDLRLPKPPPGGAAPPKRVTPR